MIRSVIDIMKRQMSVLDGEFTNNHWDTFVWTLGYSLVLSFARFLFPVMLLCILVCGE